ARMAARVERPPTAAERSRPPTPSTAVTPTSSASSKQVTCWAPVPDAATMPTGPGRRAFAKPSPSPPTMAGGLVLQDDLLLHGHVVGKEHHRHARPDGVHGLDEGVLARHRDQRQRSA